MDSDQYQSMVGNIVLTILAVCFIICLVLFTWWLGGKLL